jgi:predicted XRE-type DNA-binding protein
MPRSDDTEIHPGSGNVFIDCGFPPEEAVPMLIRADLMTAVEDVIKSRRYSIKRAANALGVSQKRTNDLLRRRIDRFDIDTLIGMLTRLDVEVAFGVEVEANERGAKNPV